jgi:hypothetical protein
MINTFRRESGFEDPQFRSYQIYFIYDFVYRKGNQKLSISQLSREFRCRSARINAALVNRLEESKVCDRDFAVDEDSEGEILEWIEA